jgi:trehalose 6-phosphate synthase/phosphatase
MNNINLPVRSYTSTHRLIVMSNRAPIRVIRRNSHDHIEPTVGGVGSTFLRLLEQRGGCWIAWSGGQTTSSRLKLPAQNPLFDLIFIKLSERDVAEYYWSMSNRGIWPLMHFMTPNCHFNARHWTTYQRVNETFAEVAAAEAASADVLWIQDFHLALTPAMVRRRAAKTSIGLFWHVPFPPEQIFRILPWRAEFLHGMLGSDLIGFYISSYATHFLNCCERILGLEVDRTRGMVVNGHRQVRVGAFPLGIPVDYFEGMAQSEPVRERVRRLRRSLGTPHVVLGVDRLDYTKGICERILGFERFLEENPNFHRQVTLVLIAVPSRTRVADYVQLKREIDEQIGRITGRFSSEGWVPIRYLYTQFGPEELIAYYAAADIALLTPLRDGMNLVAKEYIASHPNQDGMLILSEFAGAAEELPEALLVNPYDIDQIAARIKEALTMPDALKKERMRALCNQIRSNNLESWSSAFLEALEEAVRARHEHANA